MMNPDFDPYQALVDLSSQQLAYSELVRDMSTLLKQQAQAIELLKQNQRHTQLRVDILEKMISDMLELVKRG